MSIAATVENENRLMPAIHGEPEPWSVVREFSELFESAKPYTDPRPDGIQIPGGPEIGPFLTVTDHRKPRKVRDYNGAFWVRPKPFLATWITENMLNISHDSIFFEAILRDDGSCLLVAKYSRILGSRRLAFLDPETLPRRAA